MTLECSIRLRAQDQDNRPTNFFNRSWWSTTAWTAMEQPDNRDIGSSMRRQLVCFNVALQARWNLDLAAPQRRDSFAKGLQ